jgi:periplasmic protein TonB
MLKVLIAGLAILGLTLVGFASPIRVGGSVQQQKLVKKVVPEYPPEAKAKGIQGSVKLRAVINKDGTVKELKALSGPEELIPPSIAAVKQWVYEPTLLNGEPVEVITDIDVNYTLAK